MDRSRENTASERTETQADAFSSSVPSLSIFSSEFHGGTWPFVNVCVSSIM